MKYLVVSLFLLLFSGLNISAQCRPSGPNDGESRFIAAFGLGEKAGATSALLDEVAKGKIDSIFGGGSENKSEYGGRVFLTRRWGVEISKFLPSFSGYDFDIAIKNVVEARLKKCGFTFKPGVSYVGLYAIDYKAGSTVGSVDLRTHYDEKQTLHLEFIFHESYLKRKVAKRPRNRH